MWRAADLALCLVFAFSAVVQVNDPDPLRWIAMYGLAGVACVLSFMRRVRAWFPALLAVAALAWSATLVPRVVGQVPFRDMFGAFEMRDLRVEESREMYGLLITAAWMAVVAVRATRWSGRQAP